MMFPLPKPTSNLLILTLIFITTLLITSINSQATTTYNTHLCLGSKNDSSDSNYKSNLNNLLISLSSSSSLHTFSNTTSNGIYTLYLCRADLSIASCQLCVSNATRQLQQRCPDDKSAIIWYDECWLRYSDYDFFGNQETIPRSLMYNSANTTSPDQPNYGALALVYTLIEYAPFTDLMFGTNDSATPDGSQHRYAMVQCTRDLNTSDCGFCLGTLRDAATLCCQGKRGWRILAPSCSLRYEDFLFYQLPSPPPNSTPGSNTGNGRSSKSKIVGITVSFLVLVGALLGFLYYALSCRKRKRQADGETSQEILLPDLGGSARNAHLMRGGIHANDHDNSSDVPYFSLAVIRVATNNFSQENKLGEGGFGPVYKGKLLDGQEIAVKRLSMTSRQGIEEFRNEVKVVAKLQHKNLVRLLGYCLDGNEKLLIYEYLANTSLDAFLFDPKRSSELDWTKRANIIHGTARGLLYLHEDSRLKIIHRDLKASNILLDDDMNPKISDFGTARIFGGNEVEANTEKVVGTYGYMAPEYALEGLISIKSDIYSFGVLMLEIISGKKNRGFYNPGHAQSLLLHAWQLWNENKGEHLIDPNIVDNCLISDASRWIHIALLCIHDDPAERPTMSQVVLMLGSKSVNLPQLSAAPNSVFKVSSLSDQSSTSGTGTGTGFLSSDQSTATASR